MLHDDTDQALYRLGHESAAQEWPFETRETLMYRLGRESAADEGVYEQEERARLAWVRSLGDNDLIHYSLGRLSTLDDENEVSQ